MRVAGVLVVAAVVACSSHEAMNDPDASIQPDACPAPPLSIGCVPGAFGMLSLDGAWHMTGSASTTLVANPGDPPMTTTAPVDKQMFIKRAGCLAAFSDAPLVLDVPADSTGIGYACDHTAKCMRGQERWWVCVNPDGQLIYERHAYTTSTMPGGYEWLYDTYGVLTR